MSSIDAVIFQIFSTCSWLNLHMWNPHIEKGTVQRLSCYTKCKKYWQLANIWPTMNFTVVWVYSFTLQIFLDLDHSSGLKLRCQCLLVALLWFPIISAGITQRLLKTFVFNMFQSWKHELLRMSISRTYLVFNHLLL
jgi:hypothetical protein